MHIVPAILGVLLFSMQPAYAYLDPGVGSLLLQGAIAAFATLSVSITLGWRYIKKIPATLCGALCKRPACPPADTRKDAE